MIDTVKPKVPYSAPAGLRWVWVIDPAWRVAEGHRCRARLPGVDANGRYRWCPNGSVAQLDRGHWRRGKRQRRLWWSYCAEHLYGRWIHDGQVWFRKLEPVP